MMRKLLTVLAFALLLTGCKTPSTIQNFHDSPVPPMITATENDVAKAIMTAATVRGWTITKNEPGMLEATLNVRNKHSAVVSIPYSAQNFSIQYKDSSNLDHKGNTIHRNYNRWVVLLERQIRAELLKL